MSSAPDPIHLLRPTWAEVDVDAFSRNVAAVAARIPRESKLVAVLKADAYGHGAVELAPRAMEHGASLIAVALIEEAVELRQAGLSAPLIVLGPVTPEQLPLAEAHDLILGIVGTDQLRQAHEFGRPLRIHLKLDSGMGRMGLVDSDLDGAAATLRSSTLKLDAIYTHFANASDPRDPLTEQQQSRFEQMLKRLEGLGVRAPIHHSANSPATMRGLVAPGDYARVGMSLYGGEVLDVGSARLEPVLRWRTEIVRLKELPAGSGVGYGASFRTTRPSRIATLPVGYADGYSRLLSNRGEVLVCGKRAPVVGRVSMDMVTIDVTTITDADVGDEVVLIGRQGFEEVTAEEVARKTDTISYEVFCRISARVPRVYTSAGTNVVRSRFLGLLTPRQ